MTELPAPMSLRDMCKHYGITFKKALGQNLLLDDNINRIMIAAAALEPEDYVLEVGSGLGALTRRIAPLAGQLLSVEIDNSFIPCLEDQFGDMENVHIFRGDILNHTPEKLINEFIPGGTSHKFLSNLPYYITTKILFHILESPLYFSRLVVMMQDEVGQRLVAPVGSENYGILALAAKCYANVDIVHRVPASCFLPKPKVDSCVVRFRCDEKSTMPRDEKLFFMKVVRAAFAQRRKTLRNSLTRSGAFGAPKESVLDAMDAAKIDPGRRPQTLDWEEFGTLAREIRSRV